MYDRYRKDPAGRAAIKEYVLGLVAAGSTGAGAGARSAARSAVGARTVGFAPGPGKAASGGKGVGNAPGGRSVSPVRVVL